MIPETSFSAARILIVDDEPANVALLQYILLAAGYKQLRTTNDPRQVMAIFEEQRPDIILLDLMMPHLSGFDILGLLAKRVPATDCLPVLVLTADISADTKHKALKAGASDFLTKPFDHVEAMLRIRHLLHIRAQHRQLANHNEILEETVAVRTGELRATCTRLEDTLVQLRDTQQQVIQHERMSALGSMATGLAHDFNNSLSLILGYSELLQGELLGSPFEARSDEFLGTVITAAQDAAKMFNRLRSFYRAQESEDKIEGLDLNAIVEQAVSLTRPRWHGQALREGATIEFRRELAPDLPELLADAAELRELLTNLVFNAVDAMPLGGAITLRTRYESTAARTDRPLPDGDARPPLDPEFIVLEVADTGVGMDEETRRRCLEPFFTTKGDRGTGLGLAMVYGTVQRHGATIDLQSRVGEGTRFEFRFPRRQAEAVAAAAPVEPGSHVACHVLVVDDQPVFAEILRRCLTNDGHTVEAAANGHEALEKFRAATGPGFDLVITDKAMPGMGGEQLAAELKTLAPAIRIIMLSGFGELEDAESARQPAVDVSLIKPITQAALRAAVHQALAPRPAKESDAPSTVRGRTRRMPATRRIESRLRLTTRVA